MGEEEKNEPQPQAEAADAAPQKEAVAIEKISDEEFASLLGDNFGDYKKLSALMPSFLRMVSIIIIMEAATDS